MKIYRPIYVDEAMDVKSPYCEIFRSPLRDPLRDKGQDEIPERETEVGG